MVATATVTVPASDLTTNRSVLLPRRGNTLYVHLYTDPAGDAVKLKPLAILPRKATLLNTGNDVECSVEMLPSNHVEQRGYLRLRKLPANELASTVLVVKLEFDDLPQSGGGSAESDDIRLR